MKRIVGRTTPLTAGVLGVAVLGLALLAPATGASAAVEMCRGETATIVGTPGGQLVGTPGDDVIVSYGDYTVDAGDGDDLICLRPILSLVQEVDAGAGDDFLNYSIARGEPLPSVIGTTTMSRDEGWIKVTAPGRKLTIDGTAGTVSLTGKVVTTFAVSPRMLFGVAQRVTLVGTPGFDRLGTAACGTSVIRGRGAGDQVVALGDRATPQRECRNRRMLAWGGGGNDSINGTKFGDVLRGGSGNDRILGSGGTDLAVGGTGRDTCRAERERSCERS